MSKQEENKGKMIVPYKATEGKDWYYDHLGKEYEIAYETNANYVVKANGANRFVSKDDAYIKIPSSEFKTSVPIDNTKGETFCDTLTKKMLEKIKSDIQELEGMVYGNLHAPNPVLSEPSNYGDVYSGKREREFGELCKTFDTSKPTMENFVLPEGLDTPREKLEYIKTIHGIPNGGVFDAFLRDEIMKSYRIGRAEGTINPKTLTSASSYVNNTYGL